MEVLVGWLDPEEAEQLRAEVVQYKLDAERWRTVEFALEEAVRNNSVPFDLADAYQQAMKGE